MASPKPNPEEPFEFSQVEELEETRQKVPRFELLDLLFGFLTTPEELNSVLCGYF